MPLLRRLLRRRGGSMPHYRPTPDDRLVVLSSGPVEGTCLAGGRELFINSRGWFWKCRDCGQRHGFFSSQQAADDHWHNSSHAAAGRGRP